MKQLCCLGLHHHVSWVWVSWANGIYNLMLWAEWHCRIQVLFVGAFTIDFLADLKPSLFLRLLLKAVELVFSHSDLSMFTQAALWRWVLFTLFYESSHVFRWSSIIRSSKFIAAIAIFIYLLISNLTAWWLLTDWAVRLLMFIESQFVGYLRISLYLRFLNRNMHCLSIIVIRHYRQSLLKFIKLFLSKKTPRYRLAWRLRNSNHLGSVASLFGVLTFF